jgi:hypothetical protein
MELDNNSRDNVTTVTTLPDDEEAEALATELCETTLNPPNLPKDLLHQEPHADGTPRRPMNAFMIFSRYMRPKLQKVRFRFSYL